MESVCYNEVLSVDKLLAITSVVVLLYTIQYKYMSKNAQGIAPISQVLYSCNGWNR